MLYTSRRTTSAWPFCRKGNSLWFRSRFVDLDTPQTNNIQAPTEALRPSMNPVLGKHQIEKALHDERHEINSGRLKEDNPLDTSSQFRLFCEACRRGDLKACQQHISNGINLNARDEFDYTPLILVSGQCTRVFCNTLIC